MKSCVWEPRTWVMKKKQESTVWRWRRGYLDRTGWGFNHHCFRVVCFTCQCGRGAKSDFLIYSEINLNVNLSLLLSNNNPVCSLLPFVRITLQLFSVGSKVAHVQHTLDRLTAPYCHCLVCYLLKQQKNWSSVPGKLIDYYWRIVTATIGRTRRLWFFCCRSFFLFRHMSLVRICISLGEIIFMKVCLKHFVKKLLRFRVLQLYYCSAFWSSSGKQFYEIVSCYFLMFFCTSFIWVSEI